MIVHDPCRRLSDSFGIFLYLRILAQPIREQRTMGIGTPRHQTALSVHALMDAKQVNWLQRRDVHFHDFFCFCCFVPPLDLMFHDSLLSRWFFVDDFSRAGLLLLGSALWPQGRLVAHPSYTPPFRGVAYRGCVQGHTSREKAGKLMILKWPRDLKNML